MLCFQIIRNGFCREGVAHIVEGVLDHSFQLVDLSHLIALDNIREDLGYDEFEDVDEDAIMFQQGYDGDIMEVEDGESFEIPKGYVASIIEDEPYYMLFEYFEGNWDKEEIYDDIDAGWYSLNGNTIKKIKDSDIINE